MANQTNQNLDEILIELRLSEIDTREQIIAHLKEMQNPNLKKATGFRSIKDFCEIALGYDEFDTREILIALGIIITQDRMIDSDSTVQKRINFLKDWRKKKASSIAKPPYLIFSNRILMTIAKENPKTIDAFKEIPGIGPKKFSNYAEEIVGSLKTLE